MEHLQCLFLQKNYLNKNYWNILDFQNINQLNKKILNNH